jgi:polysaccharide export outer membrane protein
MENNYEKLEIGQNSQLNNQSSDNVIVKRPNESLTTISDVIRRAGGITSKTDLSNIEIIRDIPLGKGGGKKRAIIDFNAYLYESDPTNDIRIFDGDTLFFPKLSKTNPNQIPKSILSGISPKFISVNLFGRVESPGVLKLPLEATLSDAIDISGPVKPLSGKIVLIRYKKDGTILKKNIAYSARAKRGSKRNPYLKEDDLISVKNSFYGKTAGVIGEFTAPFFGIYSTKELIDGLSE